MSSRAARALPLLALSVSAGCAPLEDSVFRSLELGPPETITVREGALTVDIPVTLDAPPAEAVSLRYELVPREAQNDCWAPDFEAAAGQVRFEASQTVALVRVFIGDDELAETDETFELVVGERARVVIRIVDDDRSALLPAADFGMIAGMTDDQAPALQAALDEASARGRGVVVVEPGSYELSHVTLPPGVTLSARGAAFYRPPRSPSELVSVSVEHTGESDALPSLLEGATLDGRREEQGPYRDSELENAHLIALTGDRAAGGRASVWLESVELRSGTASGVMVGPDVDFTSCGVRASELWRDAVTVTGGATRVRLRDLDAAASEGTGLWIGARNRGYGDDLSIDAELEDVRIAAGDVELESATGSTLGVRRLTMTEPPFRLDAPGGSVLIEDSVLMLGMQGALHNFFGAPQDVSVSRTTFVVSERPAPNEVFEEAARTLVGVNVEAASLATGSGPNLPGTLAFTDCHFELAADVEADDRVYAIGNRNPDVSVLVTNGALGAGFAGWFDDDCVACSSVP